MHCVLWLVGVGPRVCGGDGTEGGEFDGVSGAEDVQVGFEVEDVVVHGAGEGRVDLVSVVGVVGGVGGLDVA